MQTFLKVCISEKIYELEKNPSPPDYNEMCRQGKIFCLNIFLTLALVILHMYMWNEVYFMEN